jgi:hypothetical protein
MKKNISLLFLSLFFFNISYADQKGCALLMSSFGIGSTKKEEIVLLQNFLIENGFLYTTATGHFGNLTLSAVKAYQKSLGLPSTGYVGTLTRAALSKNCESISGGAPASCKVWYDGCNTCTRSSVGGPLACTKMMCIQGGDEAWFAAHKPTCREYFSSASSSSLTMCSDEGVSYKEGDSKGCLGSGASKKCIADASYVCRGGEWKIEGTPWF